MLNIDSNLSKKLIYLNKKRKEKKKDHLIVSTCLSKDKINTLIDELLLTKQRLISNRESNITRHYMVKGS